MGILLGEKGAASASLDPSRRKGSRQVRRATWRLVNAIAVAQESPTTPSTDETVGRSRFPVAVLVLMIVSGLVYAAAVPVGLIHNYYGPAVWSMAHS